LINYSYKLNIEMCFQKKNNTAKYEFDVNDSPVTIGIDKQCKIILNDKIYSKFQCTLIFNTNIKHWVLEDGFNNIQSNSGTWYIKKLIK
jgi:hypothetical protein